MTKGKSNGAGEQPSKWGKGKTDPDSWWKKGGPSPNPKGRPKGAKSQKTIYMEAFGAKIVANFDGVDQEMTKRELGYHQIAQKSAAGDTKAFLIQKELDEKYDPVEAAPPTPEESAADYHTFKAYVELLDRFKVFAKQEAEELAAGQSEETEAEDDTDEGDGGCGFDDKDEEAHDDG